MGINPPSFEGGDRENGVEITIHQGPRPDFNIINLLDVSETLLLGVPLFYLEVQIYSLHKHSEQITRDTLVAAVSV